MKNDFVIDLITTLDDDLQWSREFPVNKEKCLTQIICRDVVFPKIIALVYFLEEPYHTL